MRSSDGRHWIALDHLRGVAALLVFCWHFLHGTNLHIPKFPPLAIIDEGHIGVALFMTLSGYLFAKLLDGKEIVYSRFFWNRFIRLAPLLVFVMIAGGALHYFTETQSHRMAAYGGALLDGFIFPTWPNGGWSIAVEMQFYLLLPVIFLLTRQSKLAPIGVVALAICLRWAIFLHDRTVQEEAYFTLAGRIDQFLLGIAAFQFREFTKGEHWQAFAVLIVFAAFYSWFDWAGGYGAFDASSFWVIFPTLMGAGCGFLIAYYDTSYSPSETGASKLLGRLGTYSYSIYLLHPFFVSRAVLFINHRIAHLTNFYTALAASLVCFCGMVAIAWASYMLIEKPFLGLRVRYTKRELRDMKLVTA